MRNEVLVLVAVVLLGGCVTGPVTPDQSKYSTRAFVNMGEKEGAVVAAIATRNILDNYSSKMANVWSLWEAAKADIGSTPPLPNMTVDQIKLHTNAIAEELLKAATIRDNQLSTLDRNRATELEQVNLAHSNQMKVLEGIVEAWRVQGEISTEQWRMWLSVAAKGAAVYMEQQHIKEVRKEAKKAAEAEKAAAAEAAAEAAKE